MDKALTVRKIHFAKVNRPAKVGSGKLLLG
jgi:hypothetical protein